MTRCRIGLIGAGNVATRHATVLAGFDDVELAGVVDPVPERAAGLAAAHGIRPYPDAAALLATAPDAVYVCVPPFAHGPAEEAVLAAGCAMFVEKPLAVGYPAAAALASAAGGAVTAVGHHWRYLDTVAKARELLAGREVRLVTGSWLDKVPPVSWWARRELSGGQLVEQAVHVLDLARYLVGEVDSVYGVADGAPPPAGGDVDGATAAVLRFAGGAVGTLAATCRLGWKHRAGLELYADGLALTVTEDALLVRDGAGPEQRTDADQDAAKRAVDRAFVDAVLGHGDDVRSPYRDALRSHALACAVAESVATGEVVRPGG
jgi:predicted dehydrogenase